MTGQASGHLKSLIAENIDHAIEESPYSGAEIARRLEAGEKSIRRWRSGEVTPGQTNMQRLALLLSVDVAWFYTDHERKAA